MRLRGKTAIVTGAGRGIGRAIVRSFIQEGASVLALGRNHSDLEHTLSGESGSSFARTCDVRDRTAVDDAVVAAIERWGRIDVLVNNAGVEDATPMLQVDHDAWRNVIETNLTAAFVTSQRVAQQMRAQGTGGVLLHTASIDAHGADGPFIAYNASKAGLLGLNRTLAVELAEYGIRSNCVSPGFVDTEMTERAVGPATKDYLSTRFDRVPIRRLIRCDEIAAAFVFLASDDATAITGIDLRVDGGVTANLYILETIPTVTTTQEDHT